MPFKTSCGTISRIRILIAIGHLTDVTIPKLQEFGGLDELAAMLRSKSINTLDIDCCGSECGPDCDKAFGSTCPYRDVTYINYGENYIFLSGNYINFCKLGTKSQVNCDVTLFHELVHTCGGSEIDAWALENHFYNGHGTFEPNISLRSIFLNETSKVSPSLRAGRFVVWERPAGRVFVKTQSGGGSWLSSPTVTKGEELNVMGPAYIIGF